MLQKKADNTTPTIQAAILAAYSLNVGNLRDTGHSAEATPPAAMADDLPVISELSTAPHPRPISVEQSWALNPSATLFSYLMSS
jgi:hypothetical protein